MKSLRDNLQHNNYPGSITSAPRNLDRTAENNTQELITVYVKCLAEKIQKICCPYDIKTIFRSQSTLRKYLFRVKFPTEYNVTKSCVYSILCTHRKVCKR